MHVQRVRLKNNELRYLLLDDNWQVVEPVHKYLKHLDRLDRSIYTLRSYCYSLKIYYEFLLDRKLTYLSISEPGKRVLLLTDFIGYLKTWQDKTVVEIGSRRKACSINCIMNAVLGFYRFLANNGDIEHLEFLRPIAKTSYYGAFAELSRYNNRYTQRSFLRLKEKQREVKTCSRKDVMTLVDACDFLRDKLLLLLLYEGGLRIGEALNMWVKDFVVWKNQINIVPHQDANQMARIKNLNGGVLDIPAWVMRLFCRYIAEEYPRKDYSYVFVNLKGKHVGEPLQVGTVEMKFKQLGRKCGIKIHPHVLRRSHATELIEVGDWDVLDVKTRLRHKHVQTTIQSYIRLSDSYKKEKLREFYQRVKQHEKMDE